ncbi:heat shock protein DnaJ, partial [Aulographum hederae CBS 113979]
MDSPLPPDPYSALGVSKTADAATIKKSYRKLVLTCHPDKITDETLKAQKAEDFHKIQQAYEIIGDDDKRQRYD